MLIIKIGGGKNINYRGIIQNLKLLKDKYLIVHGANYLRDQIAHQLNYQIKTLTSPQGYTSIKSDPELIKIFLMSYSGLRNKELVTLAQQNSINAIGLTGLDACLIIGKRNQKIITKQGKKLKIIKNDLSGKPHKINKKLLHYLLKNNYVPFLCPPILSQNKQAINTENDSIVALISQQMLTVKTIVHFIAAPGLLKNFSDQSSLIKKIKLKQLEKIEKQSVQARMKRKILAMKSAFNSHVRTIHFCDGRSQNPIKDFLNQNGTILTK
ncbi:MAG: acetylglutamate kinase [Candidatus Moranbacteria bacterium]|nr:acetylglutamate kinase [Candidatus Moranbacteria bacterium]